jgi:hypothetical protein
MLLAEYLADAQKVERLAAAGKTGDAYRKLAEKRAEQAPLPPLAKI